MKKKALVVGSVAYDIVFSVHNRLTDEVVVDTDSKVRPISMMLTAENKTVYYGGTGGNIAYGLGIQGESPMLFSVVGDDFLKDYNDHLIIHGVNNQVVVKEGEFTATFYAISDIDKDQIGIFQPNTHGDYMDKTNLAQMLSQKEINQVGVAIFSPGTGKSIRNHMSEFRSLAGMEPTVIFDPSQVLSIFFDANLVEECIELADIFIGNETEVRQLQDMLQTDIQGVLSMGLQAVIETRGAEGSLIHRLDSKSVAIPAKSPSQFVEQTGAGDAFRAGLIKGLLENLTLEQSCMIGSEMGALNVSVQGGQNYSIPDVF